MHKIRLILLSLNFFLFLEDINSNHIIKKIQNIDDKTFFFEILLKIRTLKEFNRIFQDTLHLLGN